LECALSILRQITKNAALLLAGSVSGQLVVFLCSPLLTRLYSPSDFGVFAVYTACLYVFSSVATLRNEIAIPGTHSDNDAMVLTVACIYILICYTVFLVVMSGMAAFSLHANELARYWYLLPIGVFLSGLYNVSMYARLRTSNHTLVSKTKFSQAVMGAIAQIALAFTGIGPVGLIVGQILGVSGGVTRLMPPTLFIRNISGVNFSQVRASLRKNSAYVKYDSPGALLNIVNNQFPAIAIAILYGAFAAGTYALVIRIMLMPLSIVAASVSGSLISSARHLKNNECGSVIRRISSLSVLVSPALVLVSLVCPLVFGFVFGVKWRDAGMVASWIGLTAVAKFSFDAVIIMLSAKGMQHFVLKIQSLLTLLRACVLIACAKILTFDETIMAFSLISALTYSLSLWLLQLKLEVKDSEKITSALINVLLSFLFIFCVYNHSVSQVLTIIVVVVYVISLYCQLPAAWRVVKSNANEVI
jgi:O-antigen/teichoic acid export membrane protein